MKMRQDWENIPDKNRSELERMLYLLEAEFEFNIAILYGRYAGGRMHSEMHGYELLLLTHDNPTREGWELEEFLKSVYPAEKRIEWKLHIETVNIHTFNSINTSSWFFWNIRTEGTIIYDNNTEWLRVFRSTQFRHIEAYKLARSQYDHFFINGSVLLDEAERFWIEQKPALAAIQLSHAAQFLLRAQETVFYGNFIHTPNLQKSFRRARIFSKKLVDAFRLHCPPDSQLFDLLMELRHTPCNSTGFVLPERRYRYLMDSLRKMQGIIRESCERHLFYLQHGKSRSQIRAEEAQRELNRVQSVPAAEHANDTDERLSETEAH